MVKPIFKKASSRFRITSFVLWTLVVLSSVLMAYKMSYVLEGVEIRWLRLPMFFLFISCFTWICVPFWMALVGFLLLLFRKDPTRLEQKQPLMRTDAPLTTRVAVIMPVYNESPDAVFGSIAAMYDELQHLPEAAQFDFFILSDTRNESLKQREALYAQTLRGEGRGRLYYRHREKNLGRKSGNIADFVKRWGALYESMIVLDADSIMTVPTLRTLAVLMQENPQAGIIQTAPSVVFAETLFGRLIQFSSRLYGPIFSHGSAAWFGATSNYWGHNAIIRVEPFRKYCGLGELPGKAPFGGPILSHDFVEAALLRSEGWGVYMVPDLTGSYEQIPPTPIEYLQRDKRWSQGNLQHLMLLFRPRLTLSSRTFFVFGALAYISSPLWLLLLLVSTLDSLINYLYPHTYYSEPYQLFPNWPVSRAEDALVLFCLTIAVLFVPKIGAMILVFRDRQLRQSFGGVIAIILSVLHEIFFFILFAPTMMMFHSRFVIFTLLGKIVPWDAQNRSAAGLTLRQSLDPTLWIVITGILWSILLLSINATNLLWMAPILLGLISTPLLVWISSRPAEHFRFAGIPLFLTPEETNTPLLLTRCEEQAIRLRELQVNDTTPSDLVPPEKPNRMEMHPIFRAIRKQRTERT